MRVLIQKLWQSPIIQKVWQFPLRRNLIIGATVAAMAGGVLVPALYSTSLGTEIVREGGRVTAAILAAVGLKPLDWVKLLAVLMVIHYTMELPALLKWAKQAWRANLRWTERLLHAFDVFAHVSLRVVVPVLFCLVVEGSHNLPVGVIHPNLI